MKTVERADSDAGNIYLPLLISPHPFVSLTLAAGVTMQFVRVASGEFIMGSDPATDPLAVGNELPQHRVSLAEYWIGKTEVTVTQFAAFVRARGYKTQAELRGASYVWTGSGWQLTRGANWQHPKGPNSNVDNKQSHPVTHVSWDDAQAFCNWASGVLGRTVRLPSEAEWEKAARSTDRQRYPWGEAAPDISRLNYNNNLKDTTPVGQYSPQGDSPYGCVDMAGNVWEWTSSLAAVYPYNAADGRENISDRRARILRGGSFIDHVGGVRSASRVDYTPDHHYDPFSFRVAISRLLSL